jgi:thymidine kinase
MSHGSLELIIGPMFSGKSSELIRKIRLAKIINKKILVIKPLIDNRYDNQKIVSHSFESENCITVATLEEVNDKINNNDLIIIDEGQFFPDLKLHVLRWVEEYNKNVIVGGLDGDYKRNPIGEILSLIPFADKCHKINSLCKECNDGTPALFTHRKLNPNMSLEQIQVGGSETYEPLCRNHFILMNQ